MSRFIQRDIAAVIIDANLPGGKIRIAFAATYHHEDDVSPPEAVSSFIDH